MTESGLDAVFAGSIGLYVVYAFHLQRHWFVVLAVALAASVVAEITLRVVAEVPIGPDRITARTDRQIRERADGRCEHCSTKHVSLERHHITPQHEGGGHGPDNLIMLCPNCHAEADRDLIDRMDLRELIR